MEKKTQITSKFAYWCLGFLFLFAIHYFQLHPPGSGLIGGPHNASGWVFLSLAIGFGLFKIVFQSKWVYSELTLGLLLAVVFLTIPSFYPHSIEVLSVGRLYGLLAGLLFFIVLQQLELNDGEKLRLFFLVLSAVWIEAALGWSQEYFFQNNNNFMGYVKGYPPFGVFFQRNIMASFMATGLVLSGFLLPLSADLHRGKLLQWVCLLTPLITVPLLLMLNSRTGWVGGLLGSLLMLVYIHSKGGKRQAFGWAAMIVLGILVSYILLNYTEAGGGTGMASALAKVRSDPIRERMYFQALLMILENPLLGVGFGNFEADFNIFAAGLNAAGIVGPNGLPNLSHPHNELLFQTIEGGIVALSGMLLAAFLVLRSVMRLEPTYRFAMLGLLFPIVFHSQTEFPFYGSMVHWVVFVMIIYLIDSLAMEKKIHQLKSTILIGTAGILIPLLTTYFMVTTLQAGAILTEYESGPTTTTRVENLLKIRNPIVWRDRIQMKIRTDLMYQGLLMDDTSQVQPYIDMLNKIVKSKPRWQYFQNLALAHDFLGQSDLAVARFEEASYRFPDQTFYRLGNRELTLIDVDPDVVDEDE